MHKKKRIVLVVLIPVGPTTSSEFLLDTLESIQHYCTSKHVIILVNDSRKPLDSRLFKYNVEEVPMVKPMGKEAGLYFSLSYGIQHALSRYEFDVLLRMDDDALITGTLPEKEAVLYFKKHTRIGLIGSYKLNWEEGIRSFEYIKGQIQQETSWLKLFINKHILKNRRNIKPFIEQATRNGYELGEHVLGGAYFISLKLAKNLAVSGLLPNEAIRGSRLQEDHIFGFLTYVVNMRMGDFVTKGYPMCLKLKGMPVLPSEIMKMGKKVIHSTRYYKDLKEKEIRTQFKRYRNRSK